MVRLLVQVGQEMHLAGSIGPDTATRKLSLKVLFAGTSTDIKSMFGKSSFLEVLGKKQYRHSTLHEVLLGTSRFISAW